MLPARRRLSAREVREVIKKGRAARSASLSLKYLPAPGPLRAAAVVSKSVVRGAVERNRVRRAVYRALQGLAAPTAGGQAVFFVQKLPEPPLSPALAREIAVLLKKFA
jgi:ribonuclease P protein component